MKTEGNNRQLEGVGEIFFHSFFIVVHASMLNFWI